MNHEHQRLGRTGVWRSLPGRQCNKRRPLFSPQAEQVGQEVGFHQKTPERTDKPNNNQANNSATPMVEGTTESRENKEPEGILRGGQVNHKHENSENIPPNINNITSVGDGLDTFLLTIPEVRESDINAKFPIQTLTLLMAGLLKSTISWYCLFGVAKIIVFLFSFFIPDLACY